MLAWLPGMIYFFGAVLDRVDGFVARRTGQMSQLGNELDTVSGALGMAVAAGLAWSYGQVHWSYLLMGTAYYLFHAGLAVRRMRGLPIYPLPPAMHRRAWAGFQMGYLVVALWPFIYPPVTRIAGFAFMLPTLSGFVIDWLVVSGRLEDSKSLVSDSPTDSVQSCSPTTGIAFSDRYATCLYPVASRFPPVVIGGAVWPSIILLGNFALAGTMVLLGIAESYFCLLLIGLLGWFYISNPMVGVDTVLLCCVVWSMLLGSGKFCLWQEDSHWINRYDGA